MSDAEGSNHSTIRVYFFSDIFAAELLKLIWIIMTRINREFRIIRISNNYIKTMNMFIDTYDRVYSARKWTFEHLYCIFVYFVIFALPFYFCFASKNFWFDQQYGQFQTKYYYTGYYAVEVSYINGTVTDTKSIAVIPSSTMGQFTWLKVSIDDNSASSTFKFEISGLTNEIVSTNIIVYYDVEVSSLSRVVSTAYAISVPGNLQIASAYSKLALQVSSPFNALTTTSAPTINRPPYFDINYRAPNTFSDLINAHLANDYKLQTQSWVQSVSDPSWSTSNTRTLTLNLLKDTKIVLPYYPTILQTFKLKFSLYFGMLMLSYLIFKNLLLLLVKDQALECHENDQIPSTLQTKRYN